jgi:Flp pilus assembly protein CpaB
MAALAVLLVVGGAVAAGLLALRIDERVDVLVAGRDIAPGQQITAADLSVAPVASQGLDLLPATDQSQVIGRYASQPIPAGRLLDHAMLTDRGLLAQGKAAVGVVVKPGQAPASGLQAGDKVQVVRTADAGGTALAEAVVSSVRAADSGAFGTSAGDTVVTLVLDQSKAPDIAAASAGGHIAVVLLERGGVVGAG